MSDYIVCEARSNRGRINARICMVRCENKTTCGAYKEWRKDNLTDGDNAHIHGQGRDRNKVADGT